MTISEERREKIIELFLNGVSKKDIARIENITYPTIRSILNESDTKQNQDDVNKKKEVLTKTLTDIFNYETYTEESVIDLVFNLKRIAQISGSDLGDFVETLSFVFDKIHKHTDNPIKLFNFIVDIANYLSLLHDVVKPEAFLEVVNLYYDKGIRFDEVDNLIVEIKEKIDILTTNAKENYYFLEKKINNIKNIAMQHIDRKKRKVGDLIENAKEELNELNKQIEETQKKYDIINGVLMKKIASNIETLHETEQSDKNNGISKQENESIKNLKQEKMLMEIILKKFQTNFPVEFEMVVNRVKNEIK